MNRAAIAALCCCVGLAGCSQDAKPPPTSSTTPRIKAPVRKGPSAEEQTAGMAAAPTLGKPPVAAELKFELAERPQIGQILEINLALVPKTDGGPASVQIGPSAAFDVEQGDPAFEVPEVAAGEVYRHTLHLIPRKDGVLLVDLNVAFKHDEVNDSQAFTVPVIVDR